MSRKGIVVSSLVVGLPTGFVTALALGILNDHFVWM